MEIYGIDHVEMYVGDAKQAAFYLANAFGLQVHGQGGPETGLADQRSLLLRESAVQIVLTSGLAASHPAAEYVQRHGDGVAVVGMEVDNAAVAYTELLARGAVSVSEPVTYTDELETTVVVAEVAGFGDVIHRLVERHGPRREFLPGAITISEPAGMPDEKLFSEIDHLAICVPSGQLKPTTEFYEKVFGFLPIFEEYIEVAGQGMESTVVQSPSTHVTFTLIEPDETRRPRPDQRLPHLARGRRRTAHRPADQRHRRGRRHPGRPRRQLPRVPVHVLRRAAGPGRRGGDTAGRPAGAGNPGRQGPLGSAAADLHRVHARPPHAVPGDHRAARCDDVRQRQHQGSVRGQGARARRS
ncbi:VOC family protein [Kribbella qitaiheensis]|uniref:VOC family protein n=1 Tax=Kribbella qitaiheensis TaxID=1544730 RepID=UPI001FE87061|nr:VOC family protein [Kribbella qitaiheensis]